MPAPLVRALVTAVICAASMIVPLSTLPSALAAEPPMVAGHRGTAYRPENTLAGISNAAYHGADAVEVDVRETADGYLRLLHDATLDRTTTCSGAIAERTHRSLDSCRAVERWPWYRRRSASFDGRWKIPTLSGAITRAERRGIPLLLDVKTGARNPRLVRLVRASEVPVTVQVRDIADVAWLTGQAVAVGYCCGWPGEAGLDELAAAGGSHVSIHTGVVTAGLVAAAHARGLDVHVWTVRAQNRWLPDRYKVEGSRRKRGDVAGWHRELAAHGIDGVHADEPNLAP